MTTSAYEAIEVTLDITVILLMIVVIYKMYSRSREFEAGSYHRKLIACLTLIDVLVFAIYVFLTIDHHVCELPNPFRSRSSDWDSPRSLPQWPTMSESPDP